MSQIVQPPLDALSPDALFPVAGGQAVGEDCNIILTQWSHALEEIFSLSAAPQISGLPTIYLSCVTTTKSELENRLSGLGKVSSDSVLRAVRWLDWLKGAVRQMEGKWYEPHVTVSPESEIVCEWWIGDRKLTVYFSDETAGFIKVWGPNIDTEMEEGNAEDKETTLAAWQWLTA